jgi:hypothetical protein
MQAANVNRNIASACNVRGLYPFRVALRKPAVAAERKAGKENRSALRSTRVGPGALNENKNATECGGEEKKTGVKREKRFRRDHTAVAPT